MSLYYRTYGMTRRGRRLVALASSRYSSAVLLHRAFKVSVARPGVKVSHSRVKAK